MDSSPSRHFTREKTNTQEGDICHPVLPLGPSSAGSSLVRSAGISGTYSVPTPILGTEDTAVGKTDRGPTSWSSWAASSWRLSLIPEAGLEVPHWVLQLWVDLASPLGQAHLDRSCSTLYPRGWGWGLAHPGAQDVFTEGRDKCLRSPYSLPGTEC